MMEWRSYVCADGRRVSVGKSSDGLEWLVIVASYVLQMDGSRKEAPLAEEEQVALGRQAIVAMFPEFDNKTHAFRCTSDQNALALLRQAEEDTMQEAQRDAKDILEDVRFLGNLDHRKINSKLDEILRLLKNR